MVPLHCNLHISWKTQLISGLFYSGVIISVLLMPWPVQDWTLWLILVLLIMIEAVSAQKRINQTKGQFALLSKESAFWGAERWFIKKVPYISRFGLLLLLQSEESNKSKYLWIAADSVSEDEWRDLKYELSN